MFSLYKVVKETFIKTFFFHLADSDRERETHFYHFYF